MSLSCDSCPGSLLTVSIVQVVTMIPPTDEGRPRPAWGVFEMPGDDRAASRLVRRARLWLGALLLTSLVTGCTTLHQYWDNGCKVGPNYSRPPAGVAKAWIDQADRRIRLDPAEHRAWWKTFND